MFYNSDLTSCTRFETYINFPRCSAGIKDIYADPNGTRAVLIDVKGSGYIFSPINEELTTIRDLPEKVTKVIWDTSVTDRSVSFLTFHLDNFDIW